MVSVVSKRMQSISCDDSTGSAGGDSETNTTIASSPGFDPPVAKISPIVSEPGDLSRSSHAAYDNLSVNFQMELLKMDPPPNVYAHKPDKCQPIVGESSTPKSIRFTPDISMPNPFSSPPAFEPPPLPRSFPEPVMMNRHTSSNQYLTQMTVATTIPSTFPSPGSAFTELHPKSGSFHKHQGSIQPTNLGFAVHDLNTSNECTSNKTLRTSPGNNEVSGYYSKPTINSTYTCRVCGQPHDSIGGPHLYNYTQAVDADLCCTLCHQPLVDPLDTKCGHTFCSFCLKSHLAVQALCPVDKQIINYLECQQASNIVKRLLDKLLVACPNSRFCDVVVYRSNLEEHLRDFCPGTLVPCENKAKGCTLEAARALQKDHRWKCTFSPNALTTSSTADSRCIMVMDPRSMLNTTLSVRNLTNRFSNTTKDQAFNFGLKFPGHYHKEFPHLFPTVVDQSATHNEGITATHHQPSQLSNSPHVIEGVPVSILIHRSSDCFELGFTFVGGVDTPLACILIQEIYLNGPVALDGRLRPGDQLLEVNGNLLTHVTHSEAQRLLTNAPPIVQLTVFREPVNIQSQQSTPNQYQEEIFYVKLCKRQGKVLGIKLVGKKHVPGLYILELVSGCEADLDGRMKKDDQILEINGIDLANGTQEQAAQIINSVSDYVIFKLSRRHRVCTPDILRTTSSSELNEKSEGNLTNQMENLHISNRPRLEAGQFTWPNLESSYEKPTVASTSRDSQSSDTSNVSQDIFVNSFDLCPPLSTSAPQSVLNDERVDSNHAMIVTNDHSVLHSSDPPISCLDSSKDETVCHERTVIVSKAPEEPLGISIAGGRHSQRGDTPIYVTNISPSCVLGRTKQVKKGDILLEANGVGLVGLTHNEAVEILRQISLLQTRIQLRLIGAPETCEGPENFMPSWTYWLQLPPICQLARIIRLRRETATPDMNGNSCPQPLGFSIVGGLGHVTSSLGRSIHTVDPPLEKAELLNNKRAYTNLYPCPIVIKSIVPGLLAHKDGRLKCGDLILAVNNISMLNIPHFAAVRLLKQSQGDVVLQVISWPGTIV